MGNGATIQLAAGTAAATNLDLPPGTPGTAGDLALLYASGFVAALLLAAFLIRWLRGRAAGLRLLHLPRHAAPDDGAVAVVGGLGVMLAISTTVVAGAWASRFLQAYQAQVAELLPVLLGALAICVLGLWDDVFELSARRKAFFQVLAAAAVFAAGLRVASFRLPGLGLIELEWWLSLPVTLLWFVGITNAFNLVDGADGVAGGAALMATIAMFVVALVVGQSLTALLLAVTGGAVLAFLHFNFPPATVYLGDAGSMSLGFLLAGVGLQASSKATTALAIAIPVVSLGLPIMDTALAILRRLLRGEGITRRDLGHIHHRLQNLGHSPRKVALLVFAVSGLLALASLLLLTPHLGTIELGFMVVGATVVIGLQRLPAPELFQLRGYMSPATLHAGRRVTLREAIHTLSTAETAADVGSLLSPALEGLRVTHVELRLAPNVATALTERTISDLRADGKDPLGCGCRLAEGNLDQRAHDVNAGYCEIRVPLVEENNDALGYLHLWVSIQARDSVESVLPLESITPGLPALTAYLEASDPASSPTTSSFVA